MLTVAAVTCIIFELLTSFTCQGQQIAPELLVKSGEDFIRTCTVPMGRGLNVTCTLPISGSGTSSNTVTQRLNEATLYLRKLSNLKDRMTMTYHSDLILEVITATMTIRNASYLDTGYYGCRLNNSVKFNETYIFVYPSHISQNSTSDVADDLLLPTLDVYVFEEGKANQFHLPFKPTHPSVQLYLSRKIKNHWIEVFSSEYKGSEDEIWSWDKHHGLAISRAKMNQTKGVYWCDAKTDGWTTTRYFRIFVTPNNDDHSRLDSHLPHIRNAVEYLIFPSGSSFILKCHIGIDESRNHNITWMVPKQLQNQNYSIIWETSGNHRSATLNVFDIRFRYTGNYTCHRSDAPHLFANQYVFVSDAQNLLLPIDRYYIFNETQRAVLPCRPTHPDVVVSLQIEGTSSRGKENITLYPREDDRGRSGDWLYSKFQGFQTRKNASRATAGRKYMCKATRFGQESNHFIDITVADIKLYVISDPSNYNAIVHGDDITLRCDTYNGYSFIVWHPPTGPSQTIEIDSQQYPAGISNAYQTPRKAQPRSQSGLYTTELRWKSIGELATGFYECRYNDSRRRNVAVEFYHMIVQEAQAPRLKFKQLGKKTETIIVKIKEGKDASLECLLEEGVPTPIVSWFKNDTLLDKLTPINGLTFNESKINGTFRSYYLHLDHMDPVHQGEYTCHFENRLGSDNQTFRLDIDDNYGYTTMTNDGFNGARIAIVVVLIIIVFLLMLMARIFYVRFSGHRVHNATDIAKVLEPLLAGNPERINRKLPLDGQSELLPYDKTWEFPRERLKIGKQIGAGCFGRVLKGQAEGIIPDEESKTETVAIKMVRSYADLSALASLVSELKILIHLGSHLNIVNLLGACTDVSTGDFLVIVEYCHFGNLLNHLLANRHCFVDQVDGNGELLPLNASLQNQISCGDSDYIQMGTPALSVAPIPVKSERKRSRKETTDYLTVLSTNRGAVSFTRGPQGQSNDEDGTDVPTNQPFSTRDLICWSFQIARGMDYLSGRNVIHGDLAARNVLLADNGIIKVADFGLSRKVYQDSNYKKKGEGMLPVKWMALESLTDRIFSSQSDVWAFGITMWEMFSLGKAPYPDMEDICRLIQYLECGGRMEIPRNCPNGVAQIISRCWKADPNVRPTFSNLEHMLADWVEESVRSNYVELNNPYSRRNDERFGSLVDEFLSLESSTNQQSTSAGYVNIQNQV